MIFTLIDVVLPVFLVIAAGYVATRFGFFKSSAVDGLMVFTQGFAVPCLLFRATMQLDLAEVLNAGMLLSYYIGAFVAFVLGITGARVLFKRRPGEAVVFGFGAMYSNTVLLGLPITERAYGAEALTANFAIIAIHAPLGYGLGITVMEFARADGKSFGGTVKSVLSAMFKNPLMMGIGLGFIVNIMDISLPGAVVDGLDLMIQAALPAAIFGLGGALVRYKINDKLSQISLLVVLSLLVHPAVTWLLATQVFVISEAMLRSVVVTAAMAPGLNVFLFATQYQRATGVMSSAVLVCTILSIFTATFWLSLLPAP